ncbi:glycosyltransferase family 2 protein [Flavobacterium facile]|uniref:glycosyltransferase family 2 protein n=1 Tax=Flavobacterium facile TaxID=2893174 RepID=UPI002E79C8CC|nr:glycosyltransferase [Flavobacterium sp. T-12]
MNIPKISVLMPVYNSELYIKEAIDSILNQTFTDFELIIIDDASTDKSVEIIQSYTDSRIQLIVKPQNSGYTNSLNYGLTIAKGEYIARMDSDDISMPERFAKQVGFLEANKDVVVCGSVFNIIGTGEIINVPEEHEDIKFGMLLRCRIGHPTVMIRKRVLIENNINYNHEMEPAEDYDLWVRLSEIGKLYNLKEPLLSYRIHQNQVSTSRNEKQKEASKKVKIRQLKALDDSVNLIQQEVFVKATDGLQEIDFNDFKVLVSLKKQIISKNKSSFNTQLFLFYWSQIEDKFLRYYFKYRVQFNIKIFFQYMNVCHKLDSKLSTYEIIKLFVKSLINYRVV